jgi:pimeloyl-ACP methyl ester carboxylesterase
MSDFTEGILDCSGLSVRYVEAGEGRPVIVFPAGEGELFDEVAAALATRHRVIVLDTLAAESRKSHDFVVHLTSALARLGVSSFSVIGVSRGATPALAQAAAAPEHVQRLILVSPLLAAAQQPELEARLGDIKVPTLVLVGTRDQSEARSAGQMLRARIPTCHLLLVYDAGHAIAADRREACLSPIGEFLEQGEGFIVSHDSQMIRP